jgi:hypothetical protein
MPILITLVAIIVGTLLDEIETGQSNRIRKIS